MSPASQGSLEVERYIGSNLISSCARVNNSKSNGKGRKPEGKIPVQRNVVNPNGEAYQRGPRQGFPMPNMLSPCGCRGNLNMNPRQFAAAGWTGMPLISVADGKKKNQYQDRSRNVGMEDDSSLRTPLSRLAIHTQGAPLILTGRCYSGRKNQIKGNQPRGTRGDLVIRRSNKYKDNHSHGNGGPSDCLSVASDESSGSGHSENCLPRIIKPRKRRKKDRKPSIPSPEAYEESGGAASEPPKNSCESKTKSEEAAGKKIPQKCDTKPNLTVLKPTILNGSQHEEASEDESCGPKLHHAFEDVTESESGPFGCLPSSCQCHYCDPSGIWDAPSNFLSDRNSSVFLTPPPDSNKSFHYFTHSDLVLRRSWSEPMPEISGNKKDAEKQFQQSFYGLPLRSNSFSDAKTSRMNWAGKIEGRWDSISGKSNPSISGSEKCVKDKTEEKVSYGSQCLEVSTEIVTSPNGHRDLEIRFYSTSPSS